MTAGPPDWLQAGTGTRPTQRWGFATDGRLVDLQAARETGDVAAADDAGSLYRLSRSGEVLAVTRAPHPVRRLALADAGGSAAAVLDDRIVAWLDQRMRVVWTRELSDEVVSLSMTPLGTHVLASLASGQNVLLDADKRKIASFESMRPLRYVTWLVTTPALIAAADYGFLARYSWQGEMAWNERLWSPVNDLAATADGRCIVLAGLTHGLQVCDGEGHAQGSFVLEGTAHRVALTYHSHRIATATLERQVLLLDAGGGVKWMLHAPDDVIGLRLSPRGDALVVGLSDGRIVRLALET
jgi:hypothetical protein